MVRAVAFVLATLLLAQPPRDQPRSQTHDSTASGVIRGRVVSAATGDPITNAEITISGTSDRPRSDDAPETVLTDAGGRYQMPDVVGHFVVRAAKAGYAPGMFGARRVDDPPRTVTVANGATVDGIDIAMRRAAAISGRLANSSSPPSIVWTGPRAAANGRIRPCSKRSRRLRHGSCSPTRSSSRCRCG